jgi:bifunctional DNase/RNase
MTQLVPITLGKILQSQSYTVIILSSAQKNFAIYTEPSVGRSLQIHLTKEPPPRPYTHNLMVNLLKGLGARPIQIVITNIEDTIYFARLFIEQQSQEIKQIIEIDARPSDCLILALLNNIPMFCRSDILDKAVAVENT